MLHIKVPFIIISTFVWVGFVTAISFMETWLKFRAPGITVPLGLGIGQLVYSALNKVEWLFAIIILINVVINRFTFSSTLLFFIIPLLLLIIQTFWLLPALDARATLYIAGKSIGPSYYHIYYVAAELIKVVCLFVFGWLILK